MNKLKKTLKSFKRLGFRPVVKLAPKDAVTFDRMIIVFKDKEITKVVFYNRKTDEILE